MSASHKKKIDGLIKLGAVDAAARYEELCRHDLAACESPIEELLLATLYLHKDGNEFEVVFMGCCKPDRRFAKDGAILIYQQAKIGCYRADFLIHDCSYPLEIQRPRWMVVECDGHDFHEKTKEQAKHDKRRDRYFQSQGHKVLHFTGSEIWNDASACAEEIYNQLAISDEWRNRNVEDLG